MDDLTEVENGLRSLHGKLSALEEESAMFLSDAHQPREGIRAHISYTHTLVAVWLQELEEIQASFPCEGAHDSDKRENEQRASLTLRLLAP